MYKCNLCPRKCNINRKISTGKCNSKDKICVTRASLHLWEEPCISGLNGSGTIFFSGCGLGCVYCQNSAISCGNVGKEISPDELCKIFFSLKSKGAHNINLVTGDHFALQIKDAISLAKHQGLDIPVILNTSSYITPAAIKLLAPYIDIYLADFKYINENTAKKYSNAPDYPETAKEALSQMVKNQPEIIFDKNDMMQKGVIVRHMLLPNYTDESKEILKYLHTTYGNKIYLSIMNQYTPKNVENYPEINRAVTEKEYDEVIDYAISIGIEDAFIQEGGTADESFIPDFESRTGI